MPKKKSGRRVAENFTWRIEGIEQYCSSLDEAGLGKADRSIAYDAAVIKLACCFEEAMLDSLVVAVNNDTSHISNRFGVKFPKHLSDEVCEHLITNGGYFDFRGRSGLISELKRFLPPDHYLVEVVKKPAYSQTLERLYALRNFAAHESAPSKKRAKEELEISRLASAGAWVKSPGRFAAMSGRLKELAADLQQQAPY
jgi:hypothetical protein